MRCSTVARLDGEGGGPASAGGPSGLGAPSRAAASASSRCSFVSAIPPESIRSRSARYEPRCRWPDLPSDPMELSAMQRRTVRSLMGDGSGRAFDPALPDRMRAYLEESLHAVALRERLRLSKERLNDLGRCEGAFAAALAGERPPFEPNAQNTAGGVPPRALEPE